MIRINLLAPPKQLTTSSAGQGWLVLVMLAVAAEVVACFFWYAAMQDKLRAELKTNRELQAEIQASEQKVKDHKSVTDRLALLREREDAISKLQDARTGPTSVMLEIANVLTPGRGPSVDATTLQTLRRDDPGRVFRPNWDTRRVWLTGYAEVNRKVVIEGKGRDGEDVSEFTRRLQLSKYFTDVRLKSATRDAVASVKFILHATVKY